MATFRTAVYKDTFFFQNISVAASELCLAQLDFPLYCVFNFPHLLFCRVYPRYQVQLS